MILSERDEFSDAQAVTTTAFGTGIKDLGEQPPDFGGGPFSPPVVFQVVDAATAAGAATVTFELVESDNSDLSSATVVAASDAIPIADLTVGAEPYSLRIPNGTRKRYFGVRYTVATGPLTGGSFNAFIALDRQMKTTYNRESVY